ncbi:MAG: cytochrome c biogenesis protein [Deltaproteobacteria bacterium]|nr:cytochrome c biogenesis protein [Deltaproteobacteria bacterium]
MSQHSLYMIAEAMALGAFILSLPKGTLILSRFLFLAYILVGAAYVFGRYHGSFPMTPMYLGTAATPPALALLGALWLGARVAPGKLFTYRSLCFMVFFVGLGPLLFPKDFYLPFLKTATFFSHAHLLFTILGKAAFLLSGIQALDYLLKSRGGKDPGPPSFFPALVLGFAFWTLSMFSGEAWSYLGWGLPVVWDDAVIVTYMATWFFYIALLHLHLAGGFPPKARAAFSAAGVPWLLAVNCVPDLGPMRPLW